MDPARVARATICTRWLQARRTRSDAPYRPAAGGTPEARFESEIWIKRITVLFRPISMDSGVFAAGQRPNRGPGGGTETFACRWAWHRHKVPASQANGVAARLRPPVGGWGGHDSRFQIWYFKMIKVLFRPVSMDSGVFAAGQRSNCGPGAGTETFACRWAWHRHKVPALQADGVAARLRPPPATRAGCGERSRCNHFPPDPGCHGSSALQEEYGRVRANRVVSG